MRINRRNKDVKNTLGRFHHTYTSICELNVLEPSIRRNHSSFSLECSSTCACEFVVRLALSSCVPDYLKPRTCFT